MMENIYPQTETKGHRCVKKRRGSDGKVWRVSEKVLIKAYPIFIPLFPLMDIFLEFQSSHEHKMSSI